MFASRSIVAASAAGAVPGLSTGSIIVGALVVDDSAGLSVSCAVGSFAAAGGAGVVSRQRHAIES